MINLTVMPYQRKYRDKVLELRFYSQRTHSHLDWHRPVNWLDRNEERVFLSCHNEDIIGFLGVSEPLNKSAWIRLVGLHHSADAAVVLKGLYHQAKQYLQQQGVERVFVLVGENWILPVLPDFGFEEYHQVVTLFRQQTALPPEKPHNVSIRQIYTENVDAVLNVDNAAFPTPWQMTRDELYQAVRIASSATLAVRQGDVVGYQIATRQRTRGHLARLAVHPDHQGSGIAAVLLRHMIETMQKRGMRSISVNTQDSNLISQKLYQRFGFQRNFFDLPVYVAHIEEPE